MLSVSVFLSTLTGVFFRLSVHLFLRLYVYLPVRPSIRMSARLSVCLSVCLCVCLLGCVFIGCLLSCLLKLLNCCLSAGCCLVGCLVGWSSCDFCKSEGKPCDAVAAAAAAFQVACGGCSNLVLGLSSAVPERCSTTIRPTVPMTEAALSVQQVRTMALRKRYVNNVG